MLSLEEFFIALAKDPKDFFIYAYTNYGDPN
jgi:hypothetical protein